MTDEEKDLVAQLRSPAQEFYDYTIDDGKQLRNAAWRA